ncbi:MAG: hypothetical protein F7B06_03060 [Opitutae bacterium]|nr:hypothetical protein [Opitutae bacterium]
MAENDDGQAGGQEYRCVDIQAEFPEVVRADLVTGFRVCLRLFFFGELHPLQFHARVAGSALALMY